MLASKRTQSIFHTTTLTNIAKLLSGWGYNYYGQLELHDIIQKLSQIQVKSDINWKDAHSVIAWKSLSVGKGWQAHVMAIV